MMTVWKGLGLLCAMIAFACFVLCMLREGQNQVLLSIGLSFNCVAFMIGLFIIEKKK